MFSHTMHGERCETNPIKSRSSSGGFNLFQVLKEIKANE